MEALNEIKLGRDGDIWERFRSGDKEALSSVYFQYFSSLFQYGVRLKNDEDFVKDCIQDLFIQLFRAGKNLGLTDHIQSYLFKALKNKLYKELNRQKRMEKEQEKMYQLAFHASFVPEEEEALLSGDTRQYQELLVALKNLNSRQREVIYLRYESEMSYEQIADVMQIKPESARKLMFRAIQSLRQVLDNPSSMILFILRSAKICF